MAKRKNSKKTSKGLSTEEPEPRIGPPDNPYEGDLDTGPTNLRRSERFREPTEEEGQSDRVSRADGSTRRGPTNVTRPRRSNDERSTGTTAEHRQIASELTLTEGDNNVTRC